MKFRCVKCSDRVKLSKQHGPSDAVDRRPETPRRNGPVGRQAAQAACQILDSAVHRGPESRTAMYDLELSLVKSDPRRNELQALSSDSGT